MARFSLRTSKILPVFLIGTAVIFLTLEVATEVREAVEQKHFRAETGLVLIQGGCFEMGDREGAGRKDERPPHANCVDPFYLGRTEVTVGEFLKFAGETGYQTGGEREGICISRRDAAGSEALRLTWRSPGFPQTDRSPVVCVSWNDTAEYMKWLKNKSPGKAMAYRLPTETEWEFAARERGSGIQFVWGTGPPRGNFGRKNPSPVPVARYQPNVLGLYDLEGNVAEWVYDRYLADWYLEGPKTNSKGPSEGSGRVFRGGSWATDQAETRVSVRGKMEPDRSADDLGFRIALPLTER